LPRTSPPLAAASRSTAEIYDRWPVHVYNIYVHCAPEPGRPTPDGEETQDAGFFDIGELPELSPKTEMQRLLRTIELARNPQLPSDLD